MTTGKIAEEGGVSMQTVRNYVHEFEEEMLNDITLERQMNGKFKTFGHYFAKDSDSISLRIRTLFH